MRERGEGKVASTKHGWSEEKGQDLSRSVGAVLLVEWGGPRSPLALQYLHEVVIPDLVQCFGNNRDLLQNQTFLEIVAWKLKTQFAYPQATASGAAADLLKAASGSSELQQVTDPKEPWRRIFRLWVSGESLPNIAERLCYPLEYLDLLLLRLKKVRRFVSGRGISLLDCLQNEELREFGWEQLSFLYQFNAATSGEPLYQERLMLEQVIFDLGLPLEVSDLVSLLEVVHANEGRLEKGTLAGALRESYAQDQAFALRERPTLLPGILQGLIALHWLQENKTGKLTLSEKSAKTIAGFLLPKLSSQLADFLALDDPAGAGQFLLQQNPEVLTKLMDWVVREVKPSQAVNLLTGIFKRVNRRVDLYVLEVLGRLETAFPFACSCLEERDSLIRSKACQALGRLGIAAGIEPLLGMLCDPVDGVREEAASALGLLGADQAVGELERLAQDYAESLGVRESAAQALRRIKER